MRPASDQFWAYGNAEIFVDTSACAAGARKTWKPVMARAAETRAAIRARRRDRGAGMKSLRWLVRDDFIERGRFSIGVDEF
jgi:hypothetical protein